MKSNNLIFVITGFNKLIYFREPVSYPLTGGVTRVSIFCPRDKYFKPLFLLIKIIYIFTS